MLASEGTSLLPREGIQSHTRETCHVETNSRATLMAVSLGTASIAADAKPTDPQIAHIAYTAGQIDVGVPGEH